MSSTSPSVRDTAAPPDPLRRLLLDLGDALLGGGLPVHDVEEELHGLGRALGAPGVRVAALTNGLFVSLGADDATAFRPVGAALRFEQTADVLHLVHRLRAGGLDGPRALAELDAIRRAPARWPAWVADLGALPVGVGVCMFLQPVAANVLAAGAGSLVVAGLTVLARRLPSLRPLLPVTAGFLVALLVLALARASLLDGPLRTIVATLAILLPGGLLVTGLSEIAAGSASAGTARLVSGAVQLALFLAGVAAAATAIGMPASALANVQVAKPSWWVIGLGLAIAVAGVVINVNTPPSAVPWIVAVIAVSVTVQVVVGSEHGAAIGGLAGAVSAAVAATLVHWLPGGPLWQVLYLPAFWIVVPGSFGLLNTAQIEVGNGAQSVLAAVSAVFGVSIGTLIGSVISRVPRPALLTPAARV
ncbi:threonine/serine exporter family protein [Streptomyces sp. SP17BM10]|uniref:threonine/serine exporter family protein n=1 Tax=Streptomyces sp. SP17BM10 TaxID=3002530 RepID=UPI002E781A66|nr:threonine/serine exporter family protein [Streptomyces sp. SP17BM10]MEE1784480.1 threonine/serine exporter family protein [Streptomyces sp. SP17BM10]